MWILWLFVFLQLLSVSYRIENNHIVSLRIDTYRIVWWLYRLIPTDNHSPHPWIKMANVIHWIKMVNVIHWIKIANVIQDQYWQPEIHDRYSHQKLISTMNISLRARCTSLEGPSAGCVKPASGCARGVPSPNVCLGRTFILRRFLALLRKRGVPYLPCFLSSMTDITDIFYYHKNWMAKQRISVVTIHRYFMFKDIT